MNLSQDLASFKAAMESHIGPIQAEVIPDGQIHRVHTEQDRHGQTSGWYVFHVGGVSAGAFGDWRAGLKWTWHSDHIRQLSSGELARHFREIELARDQTREKLHQLQLSTAKKARDQWEAASAPSPDHPYLQAKQLSACHVRQQGHALLVPVQSIHGLVNLQRIYPDGRKRFLQGGQVKGTFCELGTGTPPSSLIILCEGWATGATLHRLTGCRVICALNASNLPSVAQHARNRYPLHQLLIAGDDDRETQGNPGRRYAEIAGKAIKAEVLFPEFPAGVSGSDFNDLYLAYQGGQYR